MTRIFLIRHGETQWNTEGRFQGRMDSPLTALGLQQAKLAAERMRDYPLDAAYCSPRLRARRTAERILAERSVPLTELDALSEIHLGALEGQNKESLTEDLQQAFHQFWHQPEQYQSPGGESLQHVQHRMVRAIETLAQRHQGQQILLISHGAAIKLALNYFEDRPLRQLWQPEPVANAAVNCLHWCPDNSMTLELYNGRAPSEFPAESPEASGSAA